MLQDFLANRPSLQPHASTDGAGRLSAFQPLFAALPSRLPAQDLDAESESEQLEAPQIEIIREAGQVRRIVVTCTCCEKITIDCQY